MIRLNSFDIFDTLIARRCMEPHEIFRSVEEKSAFPNFCRLRIEAEARIGATDYTLDDIYAELLSICDMSAEQATALKNMEISEELDNAIPIKENLSKLRDSDILISDMYLPRNVISGLLLRAGCDHEAPIIVTTHGKSKGHIWPMLKTHVEIDLHTGDNLHSDIRSAQAHGVRARYTDASKRRPTEEFLKSVGLLELCKLIRELRLSQHDENPLLQKWSEMQIEHNIPLLVLSSIHILAECIRRDVDNVQFSSRDCFFLKRIFEKINTFKPDIKTSYFYTSRLARLSKSADYMNYVRASAFGNPLIVDLCGTGWSLTAMLGDAGVSAPFYLVHDISGGASCTQYMAIRDVGPGGDRSFFLKDERLDNSVFEKLNYVNHGSVLGVRRIPELNQFIPLHRAPNYPPEIQMYINSTQVLVEQFSTILRSYDVNRMFAEAVTLGGKFQSVFKALYEHTLTTVRFTPAFERYHAEEGLDVMAVLRGDRKNI